MKIVCVNGGSYKSFYLNCFLRLNKCDLLVFNFGIIYDYLLKEEIIGKGLVTKELLTLSRKLNCLVVAGVWVIHGKEKNKAIIVSNGEKIEVHNIKQGAKICVGKYKFVVGDIKTNYFKYNKIVLSNKRLKPNIDKCSAKKIYLFCDQFGLNLVFNKKIERKFYKYSKIILK